MNRRYHGGGVNSGHLETHDAFDRVFPVKFGIGAVLKKPCKEVGLVKGSSTMSKRCNERTHRHGFPVSLVLVDGLKTFFDERIQKLSATLASLDGGKEPADHTDNRPSISKYTMQGTIRNTHGLAAIGNLPIIWLLTTTSTTYFLAISLNSSCLHNDMPTRSRLTPRVTTSIIVSIAPTEDPSSTDITSPSM